MKADIRDQGLVKIIRVCELVPVAALLAFNLANQIDWTDLEALDWYMYNFASVLIIAVPERKADGCKTWTPRGRVTQ